MLMLMRPVTALCTLIMLALVVPAAAQKATLSTADPQVCCSYKDASGALKFFLAPKSQCPKNRVVAMERCKKQPTKPVCCLTHNGYFKTPSAERCKAAGGSIEPNRFCDKPREPVCCKTRNGYTMLIPNRCVTSGGTPVPMGHCKKVERRVCCKTPNGYYDWTAAMCKRARGTVVNPRYCRSQTGEKICCKFTGANGNVVHDMLSPKVCKAYKGTKVSNRYCLNATDKLRLRRNR